MTVVYFDCPAGAAGDMILAALLDAGASRSAVDEALAALNLPNWSLEERTVTRSGIRANLIDVVAQDEAAERSHREIVDLLNAASLDEAVRERALRAFSELAHAEATVHEVDVAEVHFHEVGAIDSIVDIVGACAALESLDPDVVVGSPLPLGRGTTPSRHGTIPVPAPATLEILTGIPITDGGIGETVTPTGAALLRAFCSSFGPIPSMKLTSVGTGAGATERDEANVLRVLVGESVTEGSGAPRTRIETNIDDMSPELFPYVIERLLAVGADDAWIVPITMKKGRAAVMLCALVPGSRVSAALSVIYEETPTLGVRLTEVMKDVLERSVIEVPLGTSRIRVKIGRRNGRAVTVAPEYDDCVQAARALGLPLKEVFRLASEAAHADALQA